MSKLGPLSKLVPTTCALGALIGLAAGPADLGRPDMLGFTEEAAQEQVKLEIRLDRAIDRENLREWNRFISSRPHHVGSPFGREVADFLAGLFKDWGYETRIETFHILFPTPKERVLTMLEPERYEAGLTEPALPEDRTSSQRDEQLPTFHFFSRDGDVTSELVYVNYGIPKDYEELERLGIDVAGKIVIARYGASWRGIKPKLAAEKGAIGCIVYSDPRDDGYFQGDVYPKGAFRMARGVQRGSVLDMPLYPGDPLTPFRPALENAERLAREQAPTLTKIPVLPVSYDDALPLLKALEGPVGPESWRGALPITYHIGPGPTRVRLKVQADWRLVQAHNVIATLPGSEYPDQWVLRGNHHDAWVNGSDDPVSGLVAMMEEARAVGELAKTGWKPKRTIVYAAWDAEEPGLIGSTEWVEAHAGELRRKAVVYLNTDGNGRGFFRVGGSHALQGMVNEVASRVIDPQKGVSVLERRVSRDLVTAGAKEREQMPPAKTIRLGALGSGSDYTPFLQHLGVASVNFSFSGESDGGSYHSIFDSFDHYTRFGDPDFDYGKALAQVGGRLTLRFANAEILPWDFRDLAETVDGYRKELENLLGSLRQETESTNQLIEQGAYQNYFDPTLPFVMPKRAPAVPFLNFAPLQNASLRLKDSANAYREAYEKAIARRELAGIPVEEVNRMVFQTERTMTREAGLVGRPWYRHHVYAPGFYTGYGVKTLPGIREAMEGRDWKEAERQIQIAADLLDACSQTIGQAEGLLRQLE